MTALPLSLQLAAAWIGTWIARHQERTILMEAGWTRSRGTWSSSTTASCLGKRYLLLDRDPLYTEAFRAALERGGVKVVRLPRHLRRAIAEFVAHYHHERNHQGLENRLIESAPLPANTNSRIVRRERLGGVFNFHHQAAA